MYFFKIRRLQQLVAGIFTVFSSMLLNSIYAQNYQSIEEVNEACAQLGFTSNADAEIAVDNMLNQF